MPAMKELPPLDVASASLLREWFENGIPFNKMLGMRLETVEAGLCVIHLPWRDELVGDILRPAVHGGVLST